MLDEIQILIIFWMRTRESYSSKQYSLRFNSSCKMMPDYIPLFFLIWKFSVDICMSACNFFTCKCR